MAGHSIPIDFWVTSEKITNTDQREALVKELLPLIEPLSGKLQKATECSLPNGDYMYIYSSDRSATYTVKMYSRGLVSTMLDYFATNVKERRLLSDKCSGLEQEIMKRFSSNKCKVLTEVKRAPHINPYFLSSDDRILEYDVDELLFEEHSDFQKVQIFHSKSFGNMLVLDNLQNLAESDLQYTHSLMNKPEEDFRDKDILILGGGDGALLWELLKEKPKFVTMIDIDDAVMKSCRQFLRSVCGSCLDSYEGENYKVIVDDAIKYMRTYSQEKRQFDYVFGDLTDIPISTSSNDGHWEFVHTILSLGTSILKEGTGKYMTHAIGLQCVTALETLEEQIRKLPTKVTFTRTSAFIPSFMEKWCFYQITRVAS